MNFLEFKTAASDYFGPAEFVELVDIDTEELISLLEENGFLPDGVQAEISEIMGVSDDD